MGHGAPPQMPKPRTGKLENATARRRLEVRRKPYYATISPAIQLGYRRNMAAARGPYVASLKVQTGSRKLRWRTIWSRRTANAF